MNKWFSKYERFFSRYLGGHGLDSKTLYREGQNYLSRSAQRQSTAIRMYRAGMDGPLARQIGTQSFVQRITSSLFFADSAKLAARMNGLIVGTTGAFNSNYAYNIYIWFTQ